MKDDVLVSSSSRATFTTAAKLVISYSIAVLCLVGGIRALLSLLLDSIHAMEATTQVSFQAMVGNHPIRFAALVLQLGLAIEVWSRSIAAVTRATTRRTLRWFLGAFCLFLTAPIPFTVGSRIESHQESPYTFLPQNNYYYPGTNATGSMLDQNTPALDLADYIFLSTSIYTRDQEFPTLLEEWFGSDKVRDGKDLVQEFRRRKDPHNRVPVVFQLVLFPDDDTAVVVVRGVQNYWDVLESLDLWAAPTLLQWLWMPLVPATRLLATTTSRPSSYLGLTTRFLEELKTQYSTVRVTGHSLGGGLAMLAGAQARVPAVGVSAPSCHTAAQALGLDLGGWTQNIVPEQDWVPKIDAPSKSNDVNIGCTSNNPFSCHPGRRSLCEVLYTVGSGNRPIPRECITQRGYPQPHFVPIM